MLFPLVVPCKKASHDQSTESLQIFYMLTITIFRQNAENVLQSVTSVENERNFGYPYPSFEKSEDAKITKTDLLVRLAVCFVVWVPDCWFGFFPPRFLEWESFSDCAFS